MIVLAISYHSSKITRCGILTPKLSNFEPSLMRSPNTLPEINWHYVPNYSLITDRMIQTANIEHSVISVPANKCNNLKFSYVRVNKR